MGISFAVWLLVGLSLAVWSLIVWSLLSLVTSMVAGAAAVADAATRMGGLRWPAEWTDGLPPVLAEPLHHAILAVLPLTDSLLRLAPELSGGLTIAAWGLWGVGAVLLIGLGLGTHALLALWRRRSPAARGGRSIPHPAD